MGGRSIGYVVGGLLLVGAAGPGSCQDLGPGSAGFGFSLAVTEYQIRDQVLNPLRHRGTSVTLELFRRGDGGDTRRRFGFSLMVNPLGDRYAPRRGTLIFHPALDYRMAWRVTDAGGSTSLFLGGNAGWSTHFAFYELWDESHVYWLTSSQVGVDAVLERRLGGGRTLSLEVDAPLVALVSRPPERWDHREVDPGLGAVLGEIHGGARLATPAEHLALRAGLAYTAVRDGKLHHAFFWRTTWIRNSSPTSRDVRILTHSLGVSLPGPF